MSPLPPSEGQTVGGRGGDGGRPDGGNELGVVAEDGCGADDMAGGMMLHKVITRHIDATLESRRCSPRRAATGHANGGGRAAGGWLRCDPPAPSPRAFSLARRALYRGVVASVVRRAIDTCSRRVCRRDRTMERCSSPPLACPCHCARSRAPTAPRCSRPPLLLLSTYPPPRRAALFSSLRLRRPLPPRVRRAHSRRRPLVTVLFSRRDTSARSSRAASAR